MAIVPEAVEEDATSKQRELEGLNINIHAVSVPSIGSNSVRYQSCEQPIEEEEKPYRTAKN